MWEVIASKDVRDYMEKRGKKLTDFNRATLAYNYPGIGLEEKTKMLREILDMTQDAKLAGQIRERLAHDQKCLETFFEKKEGMIYILSVYYPEDRQWIDVGYFISGELAYICGKKYNEGDAYSV